MKTGELYFTLTEEGVLASRGVAWGPDGLHIANTTEGIDAQHGAHLYILNALTGEMERDIELGNIGFVANPEYSPDGTRIGIVVAGGQEYQIWDAHTKEC